MKHTRLKSIGVLTALVALLVAAHGVAVYRVLSRRTWMVVLGLLVLALLIHLGAVGLIHRIYTRHFRQKS